MGSRKKRKMTPRPGARKSQAARASARAARRIAWIASAGGTRAPRQQGAALLQDLVDPGVELLQSVVHALVAADGRLEALPDLGGDLLPLRHLGGGRHALELLAEGPRLRISRQGGGGPRAGARRQVAAQFMEADLHGGLGKVLD